MCYNGGYWGGVRMENYTREQINSLETHELLEYINKLLSSGKSMNALEREGRFRRKTISDKLKRLGYIHDRKVNQYVYDETLKEKDTQPVKAVLSVPKPPKTEDDIKTFEDLKNAVNSLKKRLEVLETGDNKSSSTEIKIFKSNSKSYPRNYKFPQELLDNLEIIYRDHPHLIKNDIVVTFLMEKTEEYLRNK